MRKDGVISCCPWLARISNSNQQKRCYFLRLWQFIAYRYEHAVPNQTLRVSDCDNSPRYLINIILGGFCFCFFFLDMALRGGGQKETIFRYTVLPIHRASNSLVLLILSNGNRKQKQKQKQKRYLCRACQGCNTAESPQWRRGPTGPHTYGICSQC